MTKSARCNYIHATSQVKEHKIMHKVRKHWEVIGISALMMMAGGAVTAHVNTHADSINNTTGTQSMANDNSNNNIKNQPASIMNQAKNMKNQLLANSAMHLDNNITQKNSNLNTNIQNGQENDANNKSANKIGIQDAKSNGNNQNKIENNSTSMLTATNHSKILSGTNRLFTTKPKLNNINNNVVLVNKDPFKLDNYKSDLINYGPNGFNKSDTLENSLAGDSSDKSGSALGMIFKNVGPVNGYKQFIQVYPYNPNAEMFQVYQYDDMNKPQVMGPISNVKMHWHKANGQSGVFNVKPSDYTKYFTFYSKVSINDSRFDYLRGCFPSKNDHSTIGDSGSKYASVIVLHPYGCLKLFPNNKFEAGDSIWMTYHIKSNPKFDSNHGAYLNTNHQIGGETTVGMAPYLWSATTPINIKYADMNSHSIYPNSYLYNYRPNSIGPNSTFNLDVPTPSGYTLAPDFVQNTNFSSSDFSYHIKLNNSNNAEIKGHFGSNQFQNGEESDSICLIYVKPIVSTNKRIITRHISYVNKNGSEISTPVVQRVTYAQFQIKDEITGNLLGYSLDGSTHIATRDSDAAWRTNNNQWKSIKSPNLSSKGYGSPDQVNVNQMDVLPSNSNQKITVTYPEMIKNQTSDQSITRTINYVDQRGNQIANPTKQVVKFSRMNQINQANGQINYGTWIPKGTSNWQSITAPNMSSQGYGQPNKSLISAQHVQPGQQNESITITYPDSDIIASPVSPGEPGLKIPYGKANWPVHTNVNNLVTKVVRNIYFQNMRGQQVANLISEPVTYTRTAIVDRVTGKLLNYTKWISNSGHWNAVKSPDLSADGYNVPNPIVVKAEPTNPNERNKDLVIFYTDADQAVMPNNIPTLGSHIDPHDPNSPKWPAGLNHNDLVNTITRTIHYLDKSGHQIAPSKSELVTYKRSGLVDKATGELISYTPWSTKNSHWATVISPNLHDLGYGAPDKPIINDKAVIEGEPNSNVNVIYPDAIVTVTPQSPGFPNKLINSKRHIVWPNGSGKDSLIDSITRTIKYQNNCDKNLLTPIVQHVNYLRSAQVDCITGKLIKYSPWLASDKDWHEVVSPIVPGYDIPSQAVISKQFIEPGDKDVTDVIRYNDKYTIITPLNSKYPGTMIDPYNPNTKNWPDGINFSNLIHVPVRTIEYENRRGLQIAMPTTQLVTYTRAAKVDETTGKLINYTPWETKDAGWHYVRPKQVPGYSLSDKFSVPFQLTTQSTPDRTVIVKYSDVYATITSSDAKQPGAKIGPNFGNWPQGTDINSLSKTVSRQIVYLDKQTGLPVYEPVKQQTTFRRTARVDETTGQLVGYSKWTSANSSMNAVASPDLSVNGYGQPSIKVVPSDNVNISSKDQTIPIYYNEGITIVGPNDRVKSGTLINPNGINPASWPSAVDHSKLVKKVTRTIKFVAYKWGRQIHVPVIQHITYYRKVAVNKVTGKVMKVWNWQTDNDQWPKVTVPRIKGFDHPSIKVVKSIKNPSKNAIVIIKYHKITKRIPLKVQGRKPIKPLIRPATRAVLPKIQHVHAKTADNGIPSESKSGANTLPQTNEPVDANYAFTLGLAILGFGLAAFDENHKRKQA